MIASTTINSVGLPISNEQIREIFVNKSTEVIRSIVADNLMRMNDYKKDPALLKKGIFYGNEYYKALKECNLSKKIETMRKNGQFYHGYAPPNFFTMVANSQRDTGVEANRFNLKKGAWPVRLSLLCVKELV